MEVFHGGEGVVSRMRGTPGQDFLPSENLSLPGGEAEGRDRGRQGGSGVVEGAAGSLG